MATYPCRHPALTGLVRCVWGVPGRAAESGQEWSLPTGVAHLALRPGGAPIRVGDRQHPGAVLGGPRLSAYRRDAPAGVASAGLMLTPWAIPALFGLPASELRDQHVDLDRLLGVDAARIEAAYAERPPDEAREFLEQTLAARVQTRRLPDQGLTLAVRALWRGERVAAVAAAAGWSERNLHQRVLHTTGLSPRELSRVARLARLLQLAESNPASTWAERAILTGYADQPHLCREFLALTGLTPSAWRPRPGEPNHVPIPSETSKTARARRVKDQHQPE